MSIFMRALQLPKKLKTFRRRLEADGPREDSFKASYLPSYLQNLYRVLMSRTHRGVYVHFMDKATEQHF